jgi:stearoyl-CoA desaturase (delta-9 desaturase)
MVIVWSSLDAPRVRPLPFALASGTASCSMRDPGELDWTNITFMAVAHLIAGLGVWWMAVHFNPWTLGLGLLWFALCGLGITGGYHRLFAHPTYKAAAWLRLGYLLFGAGSVQNSALKWSNDHRIHHRKVDGDEDPYNINRGFFWAHLGWVLYKDADEEFDRIRDLEADPLIRWQHRYYVPLAIVFGGLLPMAVGLLWGDPWGALLVAGFLRLVLQYHATFAINSLAHSLGEQPYDSSTSARDHFLTALVTLGEGYHNFHHRFQYDYRNGVRAWQFDPTKWLIYGLSYVGATSALKRAPEARIREARAAIRAEGGA